MKKKYFYFIRAKQDAKTRVFKSDLKTLEEIEKIFGTEYAQEIAIELSKDELNEIRRRGHTLIFFPRPNCDD